MTYVMHRGFTLHDLLFSLRAANPEWTINLGTSVHSYRGFYEHIAVAPGPHDTNRVREVLRAVEKFASQGYMQGYKGGEYPISDDCLIFLDEYGEANSRLLIGFNQNRMNLTGNTNITPNVFDISGLDRIYF